MSECTDCAEQFRFEFCDLRTGIVRAVHVPLSVDWQTILNGFGQGTVTLPTKALRVRDVWPHLTSVYVLRTAGGSATTANPEVEFAALVRTMSGDDAGTTQLGLKEITEYLNRRMIRDRLVFTNMSQTQIAKALVDYAIPDGIPLRAVAGPSTKFRDRTYESWDRKFIGEAIVDLSNVIDGIEWDVVHERISGGGGWVTTIRFRDTGQVGADRGLRISSNQEAMGFGLDVDAEEHATFVDGIGSGEEIDMLTSHYEDELGVYPRFDAAPAWKDTSLQNTLDEQTEGYLEDHREPIAIPSATLRGLDPDPSSVLLGDTIFADINYGAVTYKGSARITGISWALGPDEPTTRTLDLQPVGRASESVLNQTADDDCPEC